MKKKPSWGSRPIPVSHKPPKPPPGFQRAHTEGFKSTHTYKYIAHCIKRPT